MTVTGPMPSFFETDGVGLYIKAGTVLDFETKTSYSVTVSVDDATVGGAPDATASYALAVTDVVNETPSLTPLVIISEVTPWSSGNSPLCRRLVRGDEHRLEPREHHGLEDGRQLERRSTTAVAADRHHAASPPANR